MPLSKHDVYEALDASLPLCFIFFPPPINHLKLQFYRIAIFWECHGSLFLLNFVMVILPLAASFPVLSPVQFLKIHVNDESSPRILPPLYLSFDFNSNSNLRHGIHHCFFI